MNDKTKIAGVVLGVVALILALVAVNRPAQVLTETKVVEKTLGAATGPDLPYLYISVGGVRQWSSNASLVTATSTFCAFQSPAATSTLRSAGINFLTSSTSPMIVDIGRGNNSNSTTTERLGSAVKIATSTQAFISASSTPFSSPFAPNQWLVFRASVDVAASSINGSGASATFSPTGSCHATFESYE